jgi:hypothetical protein
MFEQRSAPESQAWAAAPNAATSIPARAGRMSSHRKQIPNRGCARHPIRCPMPPERARYPDSDCRPGQRTHRPHAAHPAREDIHSRGNQQQGAPRFGAPSLRSPFSSRNSLSPTQPSSNRLHGETLLNEPPRAEPPAPHEPRVYILVPATLVSDFGHRVAL